MSKRLEHREKLGAIEVAALRVALSLPPHSVAEEALHRAVAGIAAVGSLLDQLGYGPLLPRQLGPGPWLSIGQRAELHGQRCSWCARSSAHPRGPPPPARAGRARRALLALGVMAARGGAAAVRLVFRFLV
jgi:hypothetical protein